MKQLRPWFYSTPVECHDSPSFCRIQAIEGLSGLPPTGVGRALSSGALPNETGSPTWGGEYFSDLHINNQTQQAFRSPSCIFLKETGSFRYEVHRDITQMGDAVALLLCKTAVHLTRLMRF